MAGSVFLARDLDKELLQRVGFTETLMPENEHAIRMARYVADDCCPAPFG
jgi:hypothetical protein